MKEKQNQKAVDNVAGLPEIIRNNVKDAMVEALKQNGEKPAPQADKPVFAGGRA
jgi:hypothetical protein